MWIKQLDPPTFEPIKAACVVHLNVCHPKDTSLTPLCLLNALETVAVHCVFEMSDSVLKHHTVGMKDDNTDAAVVRGPCPPMPWRDVGRL